MPLLHSRYPNRTSAALIARKLQTFETRCLYQRAPTRIGRHFLRLQAAHCNAVFQADHR